MEEKFKQPITEISENSLKLGKKIGEGGYGIVYQGTYKDAEGKETIVAVKQLSFVANQTEQNYFMREIKFMANLSHKNILGLYGICRYPNSIAIVMPYMATGSLRTILDNQSIPLSWDLRCSIALDLGKGLAYLQKVGVIHRDLKSENILLTEHYLPKIADFGLARFQNLKTLRTGAGTPYWMAPEVLGMYNEGSFASDIYAYALVLWEIASGKIPFSQLRTQQELYQKIVVKHEREVISTDWPPIYAQQIRQGWVNDPKQRPTAEQIVLALEKISPTPIKKALPLPVPDHMPIDYQLLSPKPQDKQNVIDFYQKHPFPADYEIAEILIISNSHAMSSFETYLSELQRKHHDTSLLKEVLPIDKETAITQLKLKSKPYTDPKHPNVHRLLVWTMVNSRSLETICQQSIRG